MPKTIILSFDDGRSDFYTRALPIMKKYGIPSTLNVITRFMRDMDGHEKISCSDYSVGLTKEELMECYHSGLVEIANHGAHHQNTREDIEQCIDDLQNLGINEPRFGFASPGSAITEGNKYNNGVWNLIEKNELLYIRSGIQLRREGLFYTAVSILDKYIHSKFLFKYLNRHCYITLHDENLRKQILPSVTVFSYTTLDQIKHLIAENEESTIVILMFHSILKRSDNGYGYDKFYWDADNFDALCLFLRSQQDINICKTRDLFL